MLANVNRDKIETAIRSADLWDVEGINLSPYDYFNLVQNLTSKVMVSLLGHDTLTEQERLDKANQEAEEQIHPEWAEEIGLV